MTYDIAYKSGFEDIVFVSDLSTKNRERLIRETVVGIEHAICELATVSGYSLAKGSNLVSRWPPPDSGARLPYVIVLEFHDQTHKKGFLYFQKALVELHFPESLLFNGDEKKDYAWATKLGDLLSKLELFLGIKWRTFEGGDVVADIGNIEIENYHRSLCWTEYTKAAWERLMMSYNDAEE